YATLTSRTQLPWSLLPPQDLTEREVAMKITTKNRPSPAASCDSAGSRLTAPLGRTLSTALQCPLAVLLQPRGIGDGSLVFAVSAPHRDRISAGDNAAIPHHAIALCPIADALIAGQHDRRRSHITAGAIVTAVDVAVMAQRAQIRGMVRSACRPGNNMVQLRPSCGTAELTTVVV